ncbi:MAG: 6-carboxytetrahydropterin synthase [Lentisphaerae bacterium]|nr:6-carboxytetrahydropterin synthase [Lentisphaerota bacterium]
MPYRICKMFEVESGHMLARHPDRCRFPHGHTRTVEIVLEAGDLDVNQMVCDYKVIKETMAEYLNRLDHAMCMNTDDPRYAEFKAAYGDNIIGFPGIDPTTEVMAKTIYDACRERLAAYLAGRHDTYQLRAAVRVRSVRVWETSSTWAEYTE